MKKEKPKAIIMYYDFALNELRERFELLHSPEDSEEITARQAREIIARQGYVLVHSNKYGKVWERSSDCPYRRRYGKKKRGYRCNPAPRAV